MTTFLEVKIENDAAFSEILMAELAALNYDSFSESESGVDAYIDQSLFNEQNLKELQDQYAAMFGFEYTVSELENKNWNEEWEKNFVSTAVDDQVLIRAAFHQSDIKYPYEVVITPQMSFGTGHHDTTAGVIRAMLDLDFENKEVLDAGTGTGILAIMAKKLKAGYTYAYDIDDWSFNNCIDNFKLNNDAKIEIEKGDVGLVQKLGKKFDIVLANINKNVLLADIPVFATHLKENGYLVLSGFYENDIPDIVLTTKNQGLELVKQSVSEHKWTVLVLKKV